MTDEDLNKRIHDIMGLCWHIRSTNECIVCHKMLFKIIGGGNFECLPANIDFVNTWEGFGILWEFMQKHEQWDKFRLRFCAYDEITNKHWCLNVKLISPPVFAKAVVGFFEDK